MGNFMELGDLVAYEALRFSFISCTHIRTLQIMYVWRDGYIELFNKIAVCYW